MSIEYVSSPNTDAWESELAELSAHIASATWRQLTLIRLIEPTGRWALDGAKSYPAWLSWRIGLAPGAAREKIRVARALGRLPRINEAFAKANLSLSKVRALTRVADASNEGTLLEWALHTTAAHLETICRGIRCVERGENGDVVERRPVERWARQRVMEDGSVRIEAQLLPDEAALVWRALEVARGIGAPEVRDVGEGVIDGASALVRIAESFLANGTQARPGDERTELVVHLENDRLRDAGDALEARLEDGARSRGDAASRRVRLLGARGGGRRGRDAARRRSPQATRPTAAAPRALATRSVLSVPGMRAPRVARRAPHPSLAPRRLDRCG